MICLIVGHRGSGKSSFLKRINSYCPTSLCFDLDEEIEKITQLSVDKIFAEQGEAQFRQYEKIILQQLVNENKHQDCIFIVLGAGFNQRIPEGCHVIWWQRATDQDGRIFFDRPRLNSEISAFDEYLQRFPQREMFYSQLSHEAFEAGEGQEFDCLAERVFLGLQAAQLNLSLTIFEHQVNTFEKAKLYFAKRKKWGVRYFEVRDDLISKSTFNIVKEFVTESELLFSFRTQNSWQQQNLLKNIIWDWPLEMGTPPEEPPILSLHETKSDESLADLMKRLTSFEAHHYKLAPIVNSFAELKMGYEWWQQDPERRSFLPRSTNGRWSWFRNLLGPRQKLNFVREGRGQVLDQPSLQEWVGVHAFSQASVKDFAAVLGSPIKHSQTPTIQKQYFKEKPVFQIEIKENEYNLETLQWLNSLGLRWAAVTAPFKQLATEYSTPAGDWGSVNTLYFNPSGTIVSTNTDAIGFKKLVEPYLEFQPVVIWGGGGTREIMHQVLPQAHLYSARSARAIDHPAENPQVVVWGVGRSRQSDCQWPPENWKPKVVLDLNYTMDSPGREYALRVGAEYVSGIKMLQQQGLAQQEFWNEC